MAPLEPLSIASLAVGFLAYATVVGNPFRRLLLAPEILEGPTPSLVIRWVTSLCSGLAIMPLVYVILGFVPGWAGPEATWGLLVGTLAWNLVLYRKELPQLPKKFIATLRAHFDRFDRMFTFLFLAMLAVHLTPLVGLWTTPGDDAKLYSLITQRFIETRGLPQTWGIFAPPSWYAERTHLLLPGFSAVAASVVYLFGTGIPETVSVISSVFRILPVASLYVVAWKLLGRKLPAFLTAVLYGLGITEPIVGWFTWGGMAELAAIALLPLAVAATYSLYERRPSSKRLYAWLAVILGGMVLLHPFAFFYFLAFLIPLTALVLLRGPRIVLGRLWFPVALSLLLVALPIFNAVGSELAISIEYSAYNPGWTPVASWSMIPSSVASSIVLRAMTVYGPATTVLLFLAIMLSRGLLQRERPALAMLGLWTAGMFFLHENNPNGLWTVPFPLWYRIDANRTFGVTSFIAAPVAALALERVLRWAFPPGQEKREDSIWRRFRSLRSDRARLAALLVLTLLAANQLLATGAMYYGSRSLSPITSDDIVAFEWIRSHTSNSATFFVNWADAGSWIPIFADRRVVMPFGVVTNYSLLTVYSQAVENFTADRGSNSSVRLMQQLGVQYLYAGPGRIFGRQGFNSTWIAATGFFDVAYHGGSVWIFALNQTQFPITPPGGLLSPKAAEPLGTCRSTPDVIG